MHNDDHDGDLIMGAPRIAAFLGIGEHALRGLHRKGKVPVFRLGHKLAARRSALEAHFAELEARAMAEATAAREAAE